ncbi:hypothetical protein A3A20_01710 [Candidatus Wolfebacteria bacterium RIFCSPLOWO2_01_FULL_45_19]|uniref:UDP-N-acetylglucosamine--N-acetylmuramyl-(pentapeptide) pyrophosphoryl-undecaprenol N-acetylglucosamine transferase n=1 Tax=Candidatus Wolfebacteria bacterium RIFCSPLOWO2_01_FULL_45_19 TaxID=1802557 RepID=A0A1F8DTA4_9BACT|nr:MAG: hypothetical protein UX23_C0002G0047 [Parcubacteria group bacterium GW2011_GWB1_45_9]OGM91636.1 MAG: hypothetical protein A3A20_01710 [Candidatus Wolfebacteria bacterium RIFCSPLOWO2_01_FULL_45_19]
MTRIRIALTGGGSGGHIYPLIAVVEELQFLAVTLGMELDIRYFGDPGEYKELFAANGIRITRVASSKLRRYFSIMNVLDAFKFFIGIIQAWWKIFFFMPNVIFSKGGPGALPVILAGRFYRVMVVIHESDSIPGRTNSISAKFAARIAVSFSSAAKYFQERGFQNTALTGNPVRPSIFKNIPSQNYAKDSLGFDSSLSLILVLGGSRGALHLNNFVVDNMQTFTAKYQVLHQTGIKHYSRVLEQTKSMAGPRYKAVAYFDDIKTVLSAADLVVSRAGAGSIFEIAAFGKPAILVPLPEDVVGGHQIRNAYDFANSGAAIVIEEENLLNSIFIAQVNKILDDPAKKTEMSEASKQFFKPNAGRVIAEEILKLAGRD